MRYVAKKAGQRLSIKMSARKSIPIKMPITFQLTASNISIGVISPMSRIIKDTIMAVILLREGKTKKSRYVRQKSKSAIYLCSIIMAMCI